MKLILASSSPRRLELLKQLGITPSAVAAANADESVQANEKPHELAIRLATTKASMVQMQHPNDLILGADTVVHARAKILPKCADDAEVRKCLEILSGCRHRVYTGVCVMLKNTAHFRTVETTVTFKRLHKNEIDAYVKSGEGVGKAGGYALQGRAAAFIKSINGSPSNVIGLPLHETAQLLQGLGYDTYA